MRIVELLFGLDMGGAERMAATLSTRLSSRGHDLHLVCLTDLGQPALPEETLRIAGVKLTALQKSDGFSPRALFRLAAYLIRHRIEAIHAHNPLVSHYAASAAILARTPTVILTIHGTATLEMDRRANALFGLACRPADAVVGVSQSVVETLQRAHGIARKKLHLIPNGIDTESYRVLTRVPRTHGFVFGTVGRLVPVKDHEGLLRAFAELRRQTSVDVRLEILGDGELGPFLRTVAGNLSLGDSVVFRGFSPEVPSFLAGIDCFVLPSKSEGLPLSLLEAMAAAIPVVATRVGAIPEVIDGCQCGWHCPPSNPSALAGAMLAALTSNSLDAIGKRGRAEVARRFSLDHMTDLYEVLLRRVLDK